MECARQGCRKNTPGPRARYCSATCRKADFKRRRRERARALPPIESALQPGTVRESEFVPPAADPTTQVVAAVEETIALRNTYARLAIETRAELAWRCELLAREIGDALRRYFPGVDE